MNLSFEEQTIIAQCTPQGSGAIALLRISGKHAFIIADAIIQLPSGKKISQVPTHTVHYASCINKKDVIDQIMAIVMHGPKTFTGQDTVEITCHNNQFIIEGILKSAVEAGARLAQPGEFSQRAVMNNKIDLVQAEAINELIHAQTQLALKQSLAQLKGSFSYWIVELEKELLRALALCQASFEFIDEEMEFGPQIQAMLSSVLNQIETLKKSFNQQQQIRQGVRIALIGSVNAGKSSLFNALLNQERAIVTAIAGTTRDTLEAGIYTKNNFWTLVDTAGLRQTEDIIEQEGIRRSLQEAQKADIVLLIYDGSRELHASEIAVYQQILCEQAHKIILVAAKADAREIQHANAGEVLPSLVVSSKTRHHIALLEQAIEQKIEKLFSEIESPFLLNQRHYNLLLALEQKLQETMLMFGSRAIAYELLSIHLTDAVTTLSELSGKHISEAGMDMVFREFCVGK